MLTHKRNKLSSLRGEFIIYLYAPILISGFYLLFHFFMSVSGSKEGYSLGMILYWLIGCLVPVFLWTKKTSRKLLLRVKRISWWQFILLLLPVVVAFSFGPFKQRIHEASCLIIILSLPYAFVNAFCEEFFWRGLFFVHHPGNYFHAVLVPTVWFGIWHYVPLSVQPASVGNLYFILSAIALGLCWATVTYYTHSIFWGIMSHTLVDFSGIGMLYYFS